MKIDHTIQIDPDALVSDMIESWINGNRSSVIESLKNDHPALASLVILEGARSGSLSIEDLNSITNLLIEDRVTIVQSRI